jgi:hypothetical protein
MKKLFLALACILSLPLAQASFESEQRAAARQVEALAETEGTLEILSLDPDLRHGYAVNNHKVFHGFGILGSSVVDEPADKKTLIRALAKAITENEGVVAACFNPRHGFRFTRNEKIVELVICFECASARCHGMNNDMGVLLTASAQPAFDAFLSKKKVPLTEKKK